MTRTSRSIQSRERLLREFAALPEALPLPREKAHTGFPELRARYPALLDALATVPFTAPVHHDGSRKLLEWNPLAQRLYIPSLEWPPLQAQFDLSQLKGAVLRFVELAHEFCHLLLWEPFFIGRINPLGSEAHFVDWNYLTEAFCFWYADTLLLPDVAHRRLDEPSIASDSVGFQGLFNPHEVLASLGYRAGTPQLEVFLGLLAFDAEWKERHTKDSRFQTIRKRLWSFRASNEAGTVRWLNLLVASGIRDRFFESFCALPGIPSLMESAPKSLEEEDIRDFLLSLGREGLELGRPGSRTNARRVRLRRELQARAYWLLQLQFALRHELVACEAPGEGVPRTAVRAVDELLQELEQTLRKLCSRQRGVEVEPVLEGIDQKFGRLTRALGRRGAFIARRELIAPDSHLARFRLPSIGLLRHGVRLPPEAVEQLSLALQPRWEQLISQGEQAEELLGWARRLGGKGGDRADTFDRFMSSRLVRGQWSVELGALSFERNTLRELLFEIA